MKITVDKNTQRAKHLIDNYLSDTGITDDSGNLKQRYLWTDAFAVQSCFALSHVLNEKTYHDIALKLINQVHQILGKHREDDLREGWISGLSDAEGQKHPTINGLRIGKKMPERKIGEEYDQQLEWDRDGQYFHYLTRWFNSLVLAYEETQDHKYAFWSAELLKAGEKFLIKKGSTTRMVWKMNIDLSRPLVESMGAHDPLEALICSYEVYNLAPAFQEELNFMHKVVETLCRDMNWFTYDPLGIGGLLLSTKRSCELALQGEQLPASIRPEYLFSAARAGLKVYSEQVYDSHQSANSRLAFRECGMALGIHALYGMRDKYDFVDINFKNLENYLSLAKEITEFWSDSTNRSTANWNAHQDINDIMLAASLLSAFYPQAY